MKMNDVTTAADELDPKNRSAITKLIDTKVESDMDKALTAIRSEMTAMRSDMEKGFSLMKAELVHMENRFATIESKFAMIYWVIGLSTALLAIVISFKH